MYVWVLTPLLSVSMRKKEGQVCAAIVCSKTVKEEIKNKLAPKTIESKKKRICGFTLWSLPSTYQNGCGTSQSLFTQKKVWKHRLMQLQQVFTCYCAPTVLFCFVCFSLSIYCLQRMNGIFFIFRFSWFEWIHHRFMGRRIGQNGQNFKHSRLEQLLLHTKRTASQNRHQSKSAHRFSVAV